MAICCLYCDGCVTFEDNEVRVTEDNLGVEVTQISLTGCDSLFLIGDVTTAGWVRW